MDKFLKRAAPEDTKKSTTKRIKLDPAPVCHASNRQKQDPGFTVSRWGDLKHDLQSKGNIIPAGFAVERSIKFDGFCYDTKNARHHESGKLLTLKIPKRRRQRLTVCFRTRFDTDNLEFAAPFVFVLQASLFLLSGNSPADVFVVLSTDGRIALTQMQVIGNM